MIEIVQLGKEEIFLVHKLAHDIWPKAFRNIISSDQINYMLDWMYDINTLEEQVQTGHLFYVVKEDGVAKGFIGLEPNYPDIEILRIHKFYVLPECQGKGMGRVLFNKAVDVAFDLDLSTLHLNVNRFNPSVEFYKHLGFKVVAEEDIDIGRDYFMEDYIMELNLS
ncbi:MAG: GNAT family N-acetyltransferase [Crocinitomicaceae bacterium]|jgi:GNAT superfamily N-acetyltransferase|nr:GNAT family N-acetyltransferase [Crocinitomicaceae bacterium]MDA9881827.1 GNAT family N-acetyltransferase [Crocinitomicaceae bacterium]MDG1035285.1 GNAT family N-acetyltransferase [Crocinitomicaceae bacterium]MDG1741165.1 GNAT family N-acetyltransferase [Crocinitomicaceae bacterium]